MVVAAAEAAAEAAEVDRLDRAVQVEAEALVDALVEALAARLEVEGQVLRAIEAEPPTEAPE